MVSYERRRHAETRERGDTVSAVQFTGRRVALSADWLTHGSFIPCESKRVGERGFSLIELVITITIMTILTMGVVPLVKVSVKRQKEQQLRDALRQMRSAIDEFHRDTAGMVCQGTLASTPSGQTNPAAQQVSPDPRSRVYISDCTIFGVDNPDKYPPDFDTLVKGVSVMPRGGNATGAGVQGVNATDVGKGELASKTKVYLRGVPVDPFTGKAEWDLRSCYDAADADSWGGENVFDVRSKSRDTALNGEQYRDW